MSINKESVARQHDMIGVVPSTAATHTSHPDAQWFGNAGLGLFLTWGISSVKGEGDLSWAMIYPPQGRAANILAQHGVQGVGRVMTPAEYWPQAEKFNPDRYDPVKWLTAAKHAGFTYAVLITKHHDGYALWPSAHGEFSTRTHLGGRDLVKEFVAACRVAGLKVGLYYSPPDWYFNRRHMSFRYGEKKPGVPDLGMKHEPVTLPVLGEVEEAARQEAYQRFIRGQVEELLTWYGKIDIIWFDGGPPPMSIKRLRELQPGAVINPRAHGVGDFETPEGVFPKKRPEGWWELCHVWNEGGWGYRTHEIYKPTGWVVAELARVRAWGGNFLLNMAPNAHGELPPVAYQRLDELAGWWKHSGESVEGTTSGPWPERCNVPVTCRGNVWYLHVSWVWDEPVVLRGVDRPQAVTLLRTGEPCSHDYADGTLTVTISLSRLSLLGEVVKVVL